jgi:hypothetical protein
MCGCDGEPPRVFEQRWRKASARSRKLNWCCECRRTIQLDEWHEESSGYWESWGRYRTCARCVARRAAWSAIEECAPAFGQLHECILEAMLTQRWLVLNASGGSVYVKHIDRELGREYFSRLRSAHESVKSTITQIVSQRRERRRLSDIARWAKRAPNYLGEGI